MSKRTKVIMDVDTGTDDAVALILAALSDEIELAAVCTVAGNQPLDITTENTLRVLELMQCDAPVYKGCSAALVKGLCPDRIPRKDMHSEVINGKEVKLWKPYLELPPSKRTPEAMPASSFYVEYLRQAQEPVVLVLVGPLTNFAVALTMDPQIVKNVKKIVIMGGGGDLSNTTASSEYNIWFDPEAAQKVMNCGADVLLVPLDSTHIGCLDIQDCRKIRALGTKQAEFIADILEHRILVHNLQFPLEIPEAGAVHDALALCSVIDESVLQEVRAVYCEIGLTDFTEGQTIFAPAFCDKAPNIRVAFSADRKKFSEMVYDLLAKDCLNKQEEKE